MRNCLMVCGTPIIFVNVLDADCPGISLLIGALAQRNTLSMYHYHIIYDTVNFTG